MDFGYARVLLPLETLHFAPRDTSASAQAQTALEPEAEASQTLGVARIAPAASGGYAPPSQCAVSANTGTVEARKGITALRLGQILESQVFDLSVGTEELEQELRRAVALAAREKPTFVLIEGAWGGGKTHALTLLRAIARKDQFAIAAAVMDGTAVTMSEPMGLMEEILSGVGAPLRDSGVACLADLLRRAVRDGKMSALVEKGARTIARALRVVPAHVLDDPDALAHIQDYFALSLSASQANGKLRVLGHRGVRLPTMRAFRVADRPKAFARLLKEWAIFLSVMGARGFLSVFDELDVEYATTAYRDRASETRRLRRRALLREMKAVARSKAPLLVAFASAPAGGGVATEHDAVEDILEILGGAVIHIQVPTPDEKQLEELLRRIANLYRTAYPDSEPCLGDETIARIFPGLLARYRRLPNSVPRHFVRTSLEAFDLLSGGGKPLEDVLHLMESSF
ncbi:BREX system ATP-binding domain-containing protein [Deferrisoma palaeochoriense]